MLQNVKPEHTFWLKDGKSVKNIIELGRELKRMSEETFNHHVNNTKNDFANWTEHCIKDKKLATLLRTTKSQQRTNAIIERHIQELTKTPKKEEPKPSIIRTKNVTTLNLAETKNIVKTRKVTPLKLTQEKTVIKTPHKTKLHLTTNKPEIYVHEVKPTHYSAVTIASYIIFGLVVGAAVTILVLMG
ncbi:hypothetical protein KY309_01710 [Candidatus Woesearchaeota archaeon]|nr:hypothetical protein [Candidatus Woesearchaeota archaeon]MBW3016305.1 hypothetical protein [Candidatus Woesearchaeota archaeon]